MTRLWSRVVQIAILETLIAALAPAQDRAVRWQPFAPPATLSVNGVASDPSDPNHVYIATDNGVYESRDGAVSWLRLAPNLLTGEFSRIATDPLVSGALYAQGHDTGLLTSRDDGIDWTAINPPVIHWGGVSSFAIANDLNSTIYVLPLVAGGNEPAPLMRSRDHGQSYEQIGPALLNTDGVTSLVVDPTTPSSVFITTLYGAVVYRSDDSGNSWEVVSDSVIDVGITRLLAIDRLHRVYASWTDGLAFSDDGGVTWQLSELGPDRDADSLLVDRSGNTLLASSGLGNVFRSSDRGESWAVSYTPGTVPRGISLMETPSSGPIVFAGSTSVGPGLFGGFIKSTDSGSSWALTTIPDPTTLATVQEIVVAPSSPSWVYALHTDGWLYRSEDGGKSWISPPPDASLPGWHGVHRLAIDPGIESRLYALVDGGLIVSQDSGSSWFPARDDFLKTIDWSSSLRVDGRITGRIYVATPSGVAHSDDRGSTWFVPTYLPAPQPIPATSIALDSHDSTIVVAGSLDASGNGILLRSTDEGAHWMRMGPTFTRSTVAAIALDPAHSSVMYAGLAWNSAHCPSEFEPEEDFSIPPRLVKTTDGGGSWTPVDPQLPGGSVLNISFDPTNSSHVLIELGFLCPDFFGAIYDTDDGGRSWSNNGSGLPSPGFIGSLQAGSSTARRFCIASGFDGPFLTYELVSASPAKPMEPDFPSSTRGRP